MHLSLIIIIIILIVFLRYYPANMNTFTDLGILCTFYKMLFLHASSLTLVYSSNNNRQIIIHISLQVQLVIQYLHYIEYIYIYIFF